MWIIMLVRLIIFTVVLLPGWIGMVKYWLFSPNIVRNVEYGLGAKKRNLLDVYLPAESPPDGIGTPVIVFVTGDYTIALNLFL
jgi:prenylcysteine alpha-carboxyl methylesterase